MIRKFASWPILALPLALASAALAAPAGPGAFAPLQYVIPQAAAGEPMDAKWAELEKDILRSLRDFQGTLGFVIKDLQTGRTMARNQDRSFPSASMVKVPIMAACLKAVEEGRISLEEALTLKRTDKVRGSGILRAAPAGTPVTIEKLLELMITDSDNTAANMLIDLLGFDYLGSTFREFGLERTNLSRKMMDFRSRARGIENYTTPREMADILEKMYRLSCVSPQASEKCLTVLKEQKVNDRIPRYLPRKTPVAHKTGLENKVCHDAGIIFTGRGDVLVCVLTEGDTGAVIAKRMIARIALRVYKLYK
ncbi:MAG: serine hydrolase [Candidatus Aminicenantales bacterium]|jgi:beta-lactamase class A